MLLDERAGERDGRHRAGERERRQHDHLVAPRHLDDALQHRRVESERRRRVDDREQRRLALQRLIVDAARNLHHLDGVQIALPPEAVGVDRLVGQREQVEQRLEMTNGGVNVDRLDRVAAPEMDRIETLPEADEVLIVALVAGPASARAVEGIGRARHRAERDVTPADRELARRVARMQDEFLGRKANARFDEGRIETHAPRGRIDVGAGLPEDRARLVVQEVDADLLQDRKRGLMDRIRARPERRGRAARKAIAAGRPAAKRRNRRRARPRVGGGAPYPAAACRSSLRSPDSASACAPRTAPTAIRRRQAF